MKKEIALNGEFVPVTLVRHGESATLTIANRQYDCTLHAVGGGEYRLAMGGKTHRVWATSYQDKVWIHAFGRAFELEAVDPVERAARAASGGDRVITAPMPGTVVTIAVSAGETVKKGQSLLIIESMKMQTEILAARDGTVESVAVGLGTSFDRGARLLTHLAEEE